VPAKSPATGTDARMGRANRGVTTKLFQPDAGQPVPVNNTPIRWPAAARLATGTPVPLGRRPGCQRAVCVLVHPPQAPAM